MAAGSSRTLLHRIALLAFLAMLAIGIAFRDVEALAFSVAVLAGIFLLPFRKGLLGRFALAVVFVDTAFWMVPAAISNTRHGDDLVFVAIPVGLAALALAGLIAAVGVGTRWAALGVGAVALVVIAGSQVIAGDADGAVDGELVVKAKNVRFTPERLSMDNGTATLRIKNEDLFWHTFTVEELGLDVYVPVGATRRAEFEAPAGTYEFICAIPGHESAGMTGTLTVK